MFNCNQPAFRRLGPAVLLFACAAAIAASAADGFRIVGSSSSDVYHSRPCAYAQKISESRLIVFESVAAARAAGRRLCKFCEKIEAREGIGGRAAPDRADPPPQSDRPRPPDRAAPPGAERAAASQPDGLSTSRPAVERVFVSDVYDGDSLRLESGARVRLLGVACPEPQHTVGAAAREFLRQRTAGREVELTTDWTNEPEGHMDRWGRRMAYARVVDDEIDLTEALLAQGLGWFDPQGASASAERYRKAESAARTAQLGIWKPAPPPQGDSPVIVAGDGRMYHPPKCHHVRRRNGAKTMTLNEAKAAGLHPCSRHRGP